MSAARKLEQVEQPQSLDFGGGGPVCGSVLDLVCFAAGAERVVLVDRDGRVDVADLCWAEVAS